MKNIYLTGMMGCGKTAIGKRFAYAAGADFVDTDELVESRSGLTVNEIFQKYGEAEFRARESEALSIVAERSGAVVSCGGGIVLAPQNVRLMRQSGSVVYIYRDIDDIVASVETGARPLLKKDGSNVRAIFARRAKLYEDSCDVRLQNDGTLEQAVEALAGIAENMRGK